jgi:3-dehydroquinate dehydratase-2
MKILVINGPNLNLLGKREETIYGKFTLEDIQTELINTFPQVSFEFYQSNVEGELINRIQEYKGDAIVINAGGYTHTSVSLADALRAVNKPYVEVHITNVYARESYRHVSMMAAHAKGVIAGLGKDSYVFAVEHLIG